MQYVDTSLHLTAYLVHGTLHKEKATDHFLCTADLDSITFNSGRKIIELKAWEA
jgi:hypothetical protein